MRSNALDGAPPSSVGAVDIAATTPLVQSERLLLGAVAVAVVVLFAPTVAWLVHRWTMSVWQDAHGLFIAPTVAYFSWRELKHCRSPRAASSLGFLFLIPALMLHVLDTGLRTQLLSALALVLALPGLSLLFLGRERTRAIAFPLAFAVFMLPIPLAFTGPLHVVLREIGAYASARIAPLVGVPLYREGFNIHVPNAHVFIGDACSGFSTLYAAAVVACLVAYVSRPGWRRLLVLVAWAPLAIAANVVRLVLLAVLMYWKGIDILNTPIHPLTGLLTFALALPPLFWIAPVADRNDRRPR